MLTPDYIGHLPDAMIKLYSQVEQDILEDMARRISTYDYFIPAAQHQLRALKAAGEVEEAVLQELAAKTGVSWKQLEAIFQEAGVKTVEFDDHVYRLQGLNPPALAASKEMRAVLAVGLKQTKGLFQNLTRTTAHTASGQFEAALDRAWLQINSGAFDYNTAIRTAIKDLSRQGVGAVRYPTGHVDTLETAVRRAVVTGVNQTCGKVQEQLADEMGCDLMELTAHAGARPDHAVWQGQIVSRSGQSGYLSLLDIGYGTGAGFKGWNCRHDWNPYFEGSPRSYTPEMLKSYEAKNYEYNDQKLTEYEASQQQRSIERQIRRWKRENKAMEAAGLDGSESAAKLRQWQDAQKDFLQQTGFKRQGDREQIESAGVVPKLLPEKKRLADTQIGRSVGAKSKNYEIIDKSSGLVYHFVEGTRLQDVEVFAGQGVRTPLRQEVVDGLVKECGGKPSDWQHAKGFGELTLDGMDSQYAEVHWFQAKGVGKVKFKVKRWLEQ